MGFVKKLEEYLDWYAFVNESEVSMAVQEFLMEEMGVEELSFGDINEADKIAKDYIEERGLKFEPDLVVSLDDKKKKIHLSDLNNQFNKKQIKRVEKIYNVAFVNACDCIKYGYWIEAWNPCMLDDEAKKKVWAAAEIYMVDRLLSNS